ncbi:MAG TPA: hypothetical protein VHB69_02010 [Mycobacteriales bacterium]|nr:hypothetical protein [Mycobacteriales bacterium]
MVARVRITGVVATAAALLLSSGLAAQAAADHGAPVFRDPPRTAPQTSTADGSCTAPGASYPGTPTSGEQLVWLDRDPVSLTAIWLPGSNATKCVARRTVRKAAVAKKLAAAVDRAKAMPDEPLPCPFADGTSVQLYLTYPDGTSEYVEAALNGCRPISAPGRAARWGNTAAFEAALLPAAPPAWRSYLGGQAPTAKVTAAPPATTKRGTPVYRQAPASAPLTRKRNGVCTVEGHAEPVPASSDGLVWVNPKPRRVVAIWLPGENAGSCVAVRTNDNAEKAQPIAAAIEGAPAMPRGLFCPLDDGSAVRVYLMYDSGVDQYVNIELSGCHSVSAPGRYPRETSSALTSALRQIAPPGWGHYLKG